MTSSTPRAEYGVGGGGGGGGGHCARTHRPIYDYVSQFHVAFYLFSRGGCSTLYIKQELPAIDDHSQHETLSACNAQTLADPLAVRQLHMSFDNKHQCITASTTDDATGRTDGPTDSPTD
ncbi:hypothetical protein KGM_204838 [Danaus plexippus plexippus]|uniref:Uncharacterized protein n=1 Tax=Danaus plexippus plexippus TaxID=278856 RepID=A0A212FGW9_DANPL|nr:hypothetical protein KGM_204838 [Danaus plexippus plexippus]